MKTNLIDILAEGIGLNNPSTSGKNRALHEIAVIVGCQVEGKNHEKAPDPGRTDGG
jgi:hypothetical protein